MQCGGSVMATEKRLIDANELMDDKVWLCGGFVGDPYCDGYMEALDKVETVIREFPTVDAVEVANMREFAEDVVYQFGYYCQNGGRLHITHGGLSTLEHAFDILG
jgi:hypothetical protein